MIVVQLIGGLGNQMFQYAAGKALAEYRNSPLLLDLSFLNKDSEGKYTPRSLELNCFNIRAGIATASDLARFEDAGRVKRVLQRLAPSLISGSIFYESGQEFYDGFFKLSGDVKLVGFWQSEKYFLDYKQALFSDFTLKNDLPSASNELLARINSVNSVALHVRRGDYVTLKSAVSFHGTCGTDYYRVALHYIAERIKDPNIFVFSDDIEWCRRNLEINFPSEFINPGKSCDDMVLMSSCKHNIIANSSYSWWAAWLNKHEEKIVIAPAQWFKDKTASARDLVPETWVRI